MFEISFESVELLDGKQVQNWTDDDEGLHGELDLRCTEVLQVINDNHSTSILFTDVQTTT